MEYSREFIDDYIEIIRAATLLDRDACLRASVRLGFLSVSLVSLYNCLWIDCFCINCA